MAYKYNPMQGFSVLELLVAIIIITIVTAITLPNYTRSRERALQKEAISSLKLVAAAERQYYLEVDSYYAPQADVNNINNAIHLKLNEKYWDYNITTTNSTLDFTAVAARLKNNNCRYTINNTIDEPTASNCP